MPTIRLVWEESIGAISYNIYHNNQPKLSVAHTSLLINTNTLTFDHTNLSFNSAHYYIVVAIGPNKEKSPPSNEVTVIIPSSILQSIVVTPTNPSVAYPNTEQFTATGHYSDLSTHDITTSVTWTSGASNIAIVNINTGLSTTILHGSAIITATSGFITGNTTLTVTRILQSITVTPANPSIDYPNTEQFVATGHYNDSSTTDITDSVIWSSSLTNISTINTGGAFPGLSTTLLHGSTTITATSGIISGNTILTVTRILQSIVVTPINPSVAYPNTEQFTATGHYNDGSTTDISNVATWNSSNTNIATIDSNGLATTILHGAATITATFGIINGNTLLTITRVLQSIVVTPANPTVPYNNNEQFAATGHYSDNSTEDITNAVIWASGTPGSATINSSTGLASSVHSGTSTITATSGIINGNTLLTITHAISSIAITPTSPIIYYITLTKQFTAIATYTDGDIIDITSTATWVSSDITKATINSTGLATAAAIGSTNITATASAITSNMVVLNIATWTQQTSGVSTKLNSVWGSSKNNIYAVGNTGTVLHWNGSSWAQQTIGTASNLVQVRGSDSGHVYITAENFFVYYTHNNGATWTAIINEPFPGFGGIVATSIWANSSADLWAKAGSGIGGARFVNSANETSWTSDLGNSSVGDCASVLYGFSSNDMFCGTSNNQSEIFRYTGGSKNVNSWSLLSTGLHTLYTNMGNAAFSILGFWGTSDSDLYIAGQFAAGAAIFHSTDLFATWTVWSNVISTTISSGSNGQTLPQSTINVVSTTIFQNSGTIIVTTGSGSQTVTYTGKAGTTFTGCSGGVGTMSTGGGVVAGGLPAGAGAISDISGSDSNALVYTTNQNSNDDKFYILAKLGSAWFYDYAQFLGNGHARGNSLWTDEPTGYTVAVGDQGIILSKG